MDYYSTPTPTFSANALDRISRSKKGVDVIVSAGCINHLFHTRMKGKNLEWW
jgi:hypothetical protein